MIETDIEYLRLDQSSQSKSAEIVEVSQPGTRRRAFSVTLTHRADAKQIADANGQFATTDCEQEAMSHRLQNEYSVACRTIIRSVWLAEIIHGPTLTRSVSFEVALL